ncbi:MAG: stage II sporulation protein R, partial [Hyphomonadaceae bacterium]|nr:stage II sporulation protein R [Clostridia bacterium]
MNKMMIALIVGLGITVTCVGYSEKVQADLAAQVVRFHVLANSDTPADQALKLKVRDRIIKEMGDAFADEQGIETIKAIAEEKIPAIVSIAKDEIQKNGQDYDVTAKVGKYPFPTKVYGDVTLPAGNYEALRVVIGE